MKTTTFLRFSLLIPFVIWGLSFLLMLVMDSAPTESFVTNIPENVSMSVAVLFTSYLVGVIFWILPYLLLALILFLSTFIVRARTALKIFALSPLAMTLLTLATVIIFDSSNINAIDQSYIGFTVLVVALVLTWGYICVGIGYGIYRLLQRRGKIRDQESAETLLQPA